MSTYSSSNENRLGCVPTVLLLLVLLFVPVVGHIILTIMILLDDLSPAEKILWGVLVWVIPVAGPLLYLLFGQRRVGQNGQRLFDNFGAR